MDTTTTPMHNDARENRCAPAAFHAAMIDIDAS